jgi:uncharacterized protein involved in exopolysaccharide biosynthesis
MAQEIQTKSFGYDVSDLIKFAWDKRRILIAITLTAFVISIIISLMIKPRFKSTVLLYAGAEISISKSLVEIGSSGSNEKDVLTFGNDIEAERLLQILKSDQLLDHIIDKFDLIMYYKIDTSPKKFPLTTLKGILDDNIKSRRTEYNSIVVEVFDINPQVAADIANEIAVYADTIFYKITHKRAIEAYKIISNEYQVSQVGIDSILDSLDVIRSYGITEFTAQSSSLTKAYGKALLSKDPEVIKTIENKLGILQKYGSNYVGLSTRLGWEIGRLNALETKLAVATVNLKPSISNIFIVDRAKKAEKKDSPKRSLIVLISTLSAFAASLLVLLMINNIKSHI